MKFRNIVIMLLAILMAFAFASCSNEPNKPTPTPKPTPKDYYQIEVTEGVDKDYYNRDKIKIEWEVPVKAGDTISLKYRSERDIYQWDIRDGNLKWVYETKKNGFQDPILDEDGWYNLTYTFGNDINGATVASNSRFGIYFRGNFVTTDIFEIKDIMLNDEELEVETPNLKSYAKLNDPAEDFDWTVKNYTVLFATGQPGEVDKTPFAEKVVAGGFVTGAPVAKENYSLTIYTDEAKTPGNIFDPSTPITENKIFYYEYVGDPRTVSFVTNSNSVIQPMTVHYNDLIDPPEVEPELEGQAFKAWYIDAELKTAWNFDTDHIEDDLVLYAGYADPRTVTFVLNGGAFAEGVSNTKTVADGNTVGVPEAPTYGELLFLGWYKDAELKTAYDFSAPVTSDISIYAAWGEPVDITVNLNYEGADTPKTFKAEYGKALSETDKNLAVEDKLIGLVFAGWYDDADCSETKKHDFSALVTAPFTLYAKWEEATLYKMVSEHASAEDTNKYDKFAIDFAKAAKKGDVISFRYRSTAPITFYSLRNGSNKWIYQQPQDSPLPEAFVETKADDGWIYVVYTFSDAIAEQPKFSLHFGAKTYVIGDILEVQDITLNGTMLSLKTGDDSADGVVSTNANKVSIVEGGSYPWTKQTVTFNTDGGTVIADASVDFGARVARPESDPEKADVDFINWYADAEFKTVFDFANTPITKATIIYARYGAPTLVTFNSNGGSAVESKTVPAGTPVSKPEEPTKENKFFAGWFSDEDCTVPYDFSANVTEAITIHAKWADPVNLTYNLNYTGASDPTVVTVGKGLALNAPKNPVRTGYYFAGWYTEDKGGTEVDFTASATEDKTLYAHWTEPETYIKLTSTDEQKRFTVRYSNSVISPEKGDVIAFKYRPHDGTFKYVNIRNMDSSDSTAFAKDTNIKDAGYSSTTPDEDGWFTFYFVFPENYKSGTTAVYPYKGFIMEMIDSGKWQVNDSLDILGFSYNGVELTISATDNTKGLYDNGSYANPTLTEYYVADDTLVVK